MLMVCGVTLQQRRNILVHRYKIYKQTSQNGTPLKHATLFTGQKQERGPNGSCRGSEVILLLVGGVIHSFTDYRPSILSCI